MTTEYSDGDAADLRGRAFDALPNQIAVLDAEGVIAATNAAWRAFASENGGPPGSMVGTDYLAVCDAADDPDAAAAAAGIRGVLADGERFRYEYPCHSPGERRWFIMDVRPFEWRGEQQVLVIHTDVTERREAENDVERKNERLEAVTGVLSHDLRNPLTVALGRAEMMEGEHAEAVRDALERMETIIEDAWTLARVEAVDGGEPVAVGDVARAAWRHVATEDAALSVDGDVRLIADESLLTQFFENLLRNAVDHAGDGCQITVGPLRDGFYVEDDGPGIPPGERERVFEAGVTTGGGQTGLGLSIVSRIASMHDWAVSVTDGTDGGARIEVTGVERPP
ncbi:PAS domain-containing sensor histidine kinase [Halomicrobium urmianum]|uniref:PAS domain-containing sensor histidine kinase n=1 Tax=Halomicrobium urmianum TaxID=1586233 RepID=UPI001CD9A78D|nr:PAS domain-containing sensor histidine kinase [Halomicrobium urmianum]